MANQRSKVKQTRSFLNKLLLYCFLIFIGWFAAFIYVNEYDGLWPARGTFYLFIKSFWYIFSPALIPITIAAVTSFIHRARRASDGN